MTKAVLRTAAERPDLVAVAGGGDQLTYSELAETSRRTIAAVDALHAAQAHPPAAAPETGGIPVTAVSIDSAFHAARIVASLAGYRAVSAVIDPRWPLEHRIRVIESTGIGLVVSDSAELAPALQQRGWGGTVISLADFVGAEGSAAAAPAPTVRDGDEAFLMLFSSGTTSDPKAFLKTRAQYRANVAVSSSYLEPLPGVATLAPGPLSYSLTLYAVIECLATGGTVHVADRFDAIHAGLRIEHESITRIVAVPAILQALAVAARRSPERFASLSVLVTGGANLPASIRQAAAETIPDARLISYYGAAEIGFIGDSRDGDGTSIGVYDGIEVEVRDDAGAAVADGELGELWVLADACSDGYLSGTTDEVLQGEGGWATVHDQARVVDGRLELVGRAGDIAITGGHKVALTEVERVFEGVTGVDAACAVALPDRTLGSAVALVIEGSATKRSLQAVAAKRLAPQFAPLRWYRVSELPRTVGGKVRRHAVAALVADGGGERL